MPITSCVISRTEYIHCGAVDVHVCLPLMKSHVQRNLSIVETIGTQLAVLYREVSLIQR